MGEESKEKLDELLSHTIEETKYLEVGSEEYLRAVKSVESLSKANEEYTRTELDADIRNKQVKSDRFRSILDFAKGAFGTAAAVFVTLSGRRFIKKMEDDGVIPNKDILRDMPKMKFW